MKLSALDYLLCIHCMKPFVLLDGYATAPDSQEVITGKLHCNSCNRDYDVRGGVPRLVDESKSHQTDIETGQSFATAWKTFPRMDERYRQQFFDWISPVDPEFFRDKLVLECGCGKGRHAKIVSECGAKMIFAVDIGDAVEVAYQNTGHLPNVHIIQADIENMPFAPIFDMAFSLGVLHHMNSPVSGFLAMSKKLNDQGTICAWVYGRENNRWLIRFVNPARVAITSKLSPPLLKILAGLMALPVYLWAHLVAAPWTRMQEKMPALPSLFYQRYMTYIARFDFNEIHHIVYDHLSAPVANYVARHYFEDWFSEANLPNPVIRWHNQNSWTGISSHNPQILSDMHKRMEKLQAADAKAATLPSQSSSQ
ncbi:MAG: class I SAM-dependent methyltransferase [Cyanobacteria bacterium SZAS LIN-2]|nr:class I SAM-dependent methyltransferase [Cyanobacteria bacterium SZAS LIN-2]